jgi:hypothetical protein
MLGFGGSFLAAVRLWVDPKADKWEAVGSLTITALILVAAIWKTLKSRAAELKYEPLREPKDIRAWAASLAESLRHVLGISPERPLPFRITVHKVNWNRRLTQPTHLEQVIGYVGGSGGPPGRVTDVRAGIIGRAARTKEIEIASRSAADEQAYKAELVRSWGFHADEATARSDRKAWMAVPLTDVPDGQVFAVIFIDTDDPALLDNPELQRQVIAAGKGLVKLCIETYTVVG